MTDGPDPASIIEAAKQAAGDGNFIEAERLLREAAALQEATLGPEHPDLATTQNNIAFVCEQLEKFDEAEAGYRRAHAIAVASLAPGHPLIKTSLTNLVDFCAARGIPLWAPPPAPPAEPPATVVARSEPSPVVESEASSVEAERAPAGGGSRFALAAAALVVVAIAGFYIASGWESETATAPPPATEVREEPVPATPVSSPAPAPASPAPAPATAPKAAAPPPPAPREKRVETATSEVTVLKAQLCSAIQRQGTPDWQCTLAPGNVAPGTYSFYTRLLTDTATTVEHRWYAGERVHQTMRLRIPASPGNGYRTFSSNTVSPDRTGDWRVELRAADGTVLHEERFVVR